jgi:hypothetical protein
MYSLHRSPSAFQTKHLLSNWECISNEAFAQQLGMSLTFGEASHTNKNHVVWLSHLPVIRTENHRLPALAKMLLEIEILWEGTPGKYYEQRDSTT